MSVMYRLHRALSWPFRTYWRCVLAFVDAIETPAQAAQRENRRGP